jgi:hypothetical protein
MQIISLSIDSNFFFSFSEYRKKSDMAKARLDSLQQKAKQYRELMINLTGNSEKKYVDNEKRVLRSYSNSI